MKKISFFNLKEKLDFAMKDIIFDLLSVGRCRNLMPEVNYNSIINIFIIFFFF
jgi:hypothetical protein